jgi:uncharacterized membrane protein
MKNNHLLFGALVASAVASFATAGFAQAAEGGDKAGYYCQNNSCKGHSACHGHGNDSCKGQNGCKGHGYLDAKDKKTCAKAGGKWTKEG